MRILILLLVNKCTCKLFYFRLQFYGAGPKLPGILILLLVNKCTCKLYYFRLQFYGAGPKLPGILILLLVNKCTCKLFYFRLQFYGAGPKLPGMPTQDKMEKTRGVKLNFEYDPLAKYMCQVTFCLKVYF